MRFVISISLCMSFSLAQALSNPVTITVEKDIYEYAQAILADKTPSTIEHFTQAHCQRDVVDFILVQRALSLGGSQLTFEYELGNFDARNIKLLTDGHLLISFDTIWLEEAKQYDHAVYISDPIIRQGEYFSGVFTAPHLSQAIAAKIKYDLSEVSVVSSSAWYADWKTLTALNPKQLIDESDWIAMAKMVSRGWVDVMLVSFTNQQPFQYQGTGYHIVAISDLKVALADSRHFIVSKIHPLGPETFAALQRGLQQLRESGFIENAYRECGFFNSSIANWRTLAVK
ncbi:hypothetical protein ACFOEE_19205 [Pseudoalteromonas fenneropenaei]|uniref:ABC transporter substrate-binding protein n=1 Tax=Pseudoalteromonas fenneropenaei TaxID=1737459 RepID=A0ABV7CPQ1_9GAMM